MVLGARKIGLSVGFRGWGAVERFSLVRFRKDSDAQAAIQDGL